MFDKGGGMLKYYKIESGRLSVAPNEEAADIVMMGSLSQEQRSILVKEYEITEHTIASAFDSDELSRIEYDDDFTTIVFKKPKNYSAEDNFQSAWNLLAFSFSRTGFCSLRTATSR